MPALKICADTTNRRRSPRALACLVLVLLCSGCMHRIAYDTPYYKDGPYQLREPDGELKAGTHVWITGEQDTYRRVLTLDFTHAYVWSAAIQPQTEWWRIRQQEKHREAADKPTPSPADGSRLE